MTTATGYTQSCGLRPGNRLTETGTEPLIPLSPEPAALAAIILRADGDRCLELARGRYTKRYSALDP